MVSVDELTLQEVLDAIEVLLGALGVREPYSGWFEERERELIPAGAGARERLGSLRRMYFETVEPPVIRRPGQTRRWE